MKNLILALAMITQTQTYASTEFREFCGKVQSQSELKQICIGRSNGDAIYFDRFFFDYQDGSTTIAIVKDYDGDERERSVAFRISLQGQDDVVEMSVNGDGDPAWITGEAPAPYKVRMNPKSL